jgi:hypothetical protein
MFFNEQMNGMRFVVQLLLVFTRSVTLGIPAVTYHT